MIAFLSQINLFKYCLGRRQHNTTQHTQYFLRARYINIDSRQAFSADEYLSWLFISLSNFQSVFHPIRQANNSIPKDIMPYDATRHVTSRQRINSLVSFVRSYNSFNSTQLNLSHNIHHSGRNNPHSIFQSHRSSHRYRWRSFSVSVLLLSPHWFPWQGLHSLWLLNH